DNFTIAANTIQIANGANYGTLDVAGLTAPRTYTFQDGDGVLAFLTDIPAATGDGIYDGSGTVPTTTVVTITDNISFNGGEFRTQNGYWQGTSKILYINPNSTIGNLFVGEAAGNSTMTGVHNVGIGLNSLDANTLGHSNLA